MFKGDILKKKKKNWLQLKHQKNETLEGRRKQNWIKQSLPTERANSIFGGEPELLIFL